MVSCGFKAHLLRHAHGACGAEFCHLRQPGTSVVRVELPQRQVNCKGLCVCVRVFVQKCECVCVCVKVVCERVLEQFHAVLLNRIRSRKPLVAQRNRHPKYFTHGATITRGSSQGDSPAIFCVLNSGGAHVRFQKESDCEGPPWKVSM